MICNSKLTVYHKSGYDVSNNYELWTRYNYNNVWFFGNKNANVDVGLENNDNVEIRIPYDTNNLDINNFELGDILVQGEVNINISTEQDLSNYKTYVITSINNNNFGKNKHIHLSGK